MVTLVEHLRARALHTGGPFTLRSGAVTDWYVDARATTFDGTGASAAATAVLEVLDPAVTAVGGMTMGADPISVATAVVGTAAGRTLRAFSIRKEAKGHGMGGRMVGPVTTDDVVAVLEDTTTTGGALIEALEVLESEGITVVQAIALVDRSGGVVAERVAARGIPYVPLVLPADLGVEG